ncbi:YbaN family protein [Streptococcus dentiloxodontae]
MKKFSLLLAGFVSLALGLIGVLLPILPTTPFLLLSGSCFAASSEGFDQWLRKTKVYRFYVADYAETKAIAKKRKKWILLQIYVLMGISIFFAPLLPVKIGLGLLTLFITYYIIWKIPNKPED